MCAGRKPPYLDLRAVTDPVSHARGQQPEDYDWCGARRTRTLCSVTTTTQPAQALRFFVLEDLFYACTGGVKDLLPSQPHRVIVVSANMSERVAVSAIAVATVHRQGEQLTLTTR
jgi:hypothetical protein